MKLTAANRRAIVASVTRTAAANDPTIAPERIADEYAALLPDSVPDALRDAAQEEARRAIVAHRAALEWWDAVPGLTWTERDNFSTYATAAGYAAGLRTRYPRTDYRITARGDRFAVEYRNADADHA